MTNGDKIRSMSDDELVCILARPHSNYCSTCPIGHEKCMSAEYAAYHTCKETIEVWLGEEVEEDEEEK